MWDRRGGGGRVADYVARRRRGGAERTRRRRSAGASCWSEGFVRYCEARREGFVARLNREARARWSERAVESALGEPLEGACAAYRRRRRRRGGSPQPVESGARSTSASQHATSAL
ncbi:hypothetical protein ACMD2_18013 [Ananas comosus]|uniref:Uncharacterized protein n=1 Tax=Ananas comosus TaxID=4615 RepID=A0A199VSQ1_ANACO|nr:hypothetical protein ACMD2_18013 [Ananas comosus]